MVLTFDEYLVEKSLNESIINEKIDLDSIIKQINNIKNRKKLIQKLIKKFNNNISNFSRKYFATFLILLYLGNAVVKNSIFSHKFRSDISVSVMNLSSKNNINLEDIKEVTKEIESKKLFDNNTIIDIKKAKTSKDGIELIKNHEKLRLKAYKIGDGMITIGYGHANPIKTSLYNEGDSITAEEAEKLLKKDLKRKEDGVKRMLSQWKDNGYDVEITQSMFDAMVSMAFNMGISGLRTTDFAIYLKEKDYHTAADVIKSTRINSKFPGLIDRREDEYKLFIKDLT